MPNKPRVCTVQPLLTYVFNSDTSAAAYWPRRRSGGGRCSTIPLQAIEAFPLRERSWMNHFCATSAATSSATTIVGCKLGSSSLNPFAAAHTSEDPGDPTTYAAGVSQRPTSPRTAGNASTAACTPDNTSTAEPPIASDASTAAPPTPSNVPAATFPASTADIPAVPASPSTHRIYHADAAPKCSDGISHVLPADAAAGSPSGT